MKFPILRAVALVLACISAPNLAMGQAAKGPMGPVGSDLFHTTFVRTSANNTFGLLYQPETPGPNARVAIVYASPRALFNFSPAAEMASRGYQVLLVKHFLADRRRVRETTVDGLRETTRGITYMRALPGVERVVLMGHDDGGQDGGLLCCRGRARRCRLQASRTHLSLPEGVIRRRWLASPSPMAWY